MELRRLKAILLPLCAACLLLASWMLFHSLTGVRLAGCGTGSACDSVTGGPWGYIFGSVPVSLPAAVAYLLLIICISFWGSDPFLDRLLRVLAGIPVEYDGPDGGRIMISARAGIFPQSASAASL